MPRPQFILRALLVLMLAVGCFFGGIRFERERRRREDERAAALAELSPAETFGTYVSIAVIDPGYFDRVANLLGQNGIAYAIDSVDVCNVLVYPGQEQRALSLLRADAATHGYWIETK